MKTEYLDSEIERINLLERTKDLSDYGQKALNELRSIKKAISVTRCSTQLPNIYEGTLNNDRIKIIRTLADNYNVSIDTIRSLFNDGADFYKQTLTK